MAISITLRKDSCLGNGTTTTFNFKFKVLNKDDFTLILTDIEGNDTTLQLDTDYSITNIGNDDGVIVSYPLSSETPNLADGEKLTGYRSTNITQLLDFQYGGGFSPRIHENAFDKVTMILQELFEELSRRPMLPITNSSLNIETWIDDIKSLVANKVNGDGTGITDKNAFLNNLGLSSNGEIDLTDCCLTDGSNADTEAFRTMLGILKIEEDLIDAVNNIDEIELNFRNQAPAIAPQTIVAGATSNIPSVWFPRDCDEPAAHIITSGTSELTIVSGLIVAAGVEGKVYVSDALAEDTTLDISNIVNETAGTGYIYADIASSGSPALSFGYTEEIPIVGVTEARSGNCITPVMNANTSGGFIASGSSIGNTTYYRYYEAFNKNVNVQYDGWVSAANFVSNGLTYDGDEYIRIERSDGTLMHVGGVRLCPYSESGKVYGKPISWNVEGVDADGTVHVLATESKNTNLTAGQYYETTFTIGAYRYLQIRVTETVSGSYCGFSDIQWLFGTNGDFYNTAKQSHYDKDGNILQRVYIGEFEIVDGILETLINYQHGTACTLPVNEGKIAINSWYYPYKPYLSECYAIVEIYNEDRWGEPGWIYASAGNGVKATVSEDELIVITGSSLLCSASGTVNGGIFNSSTTSALARVKVYRQW